MAKGWRGDKEKHAEAGRMGGLAKHRLRGLQSANKKTRKRVARMGGLA